VRRAVRVALPVPAGSRCIYRAQTSWTGGAPCHRHPHNLDTVMRVRRARPALHLANEPCSVEYSGGHPLLRALLRALVARKRSSRPDRPPRGDQPLQAETGPSAAWHNVATRWERPASTGPSCSARESRQLTARGTLARVVLLVFLRLVMRPRTRLCRMVVWS